MKRFILVVTILLMLSGIAYAETYQIRITWPVRLRASYSLDSPIVEKALAGDVLQVVGRFNRWLKIDRNSETVWLADWVDYTRLDQQLASPAVEVATGVQAPSAIDNCCFVNRLCQSDREWVEGYWAYQRNECPAPTQPGSSSPRAAGHPTIIDGSYLFRGIVTEALDALRDRAPQWYEYVTSNLNLVVERDSRLGCKRPAAGTCCLTPYGEIPYLEHERNVFSYVSSLVHYACHSAYRSAGRPYDGYTKVNEEADCVRMDNAATDLVAPHHPPGTFGSMIGISHCVGDLTNSPRCRFVRENCEWAADGQLIDCPAIGLITTTY